MDWRKRGHCSLGRRLLHTWNAAKYHAPSSLRSRDSADSSVIVSGGITSVAALLILGDSEVGVGRDNVGWIYSGMAMRICYDIGLQLDSRHTGMSEREIDIRKMTLWACVIYDRYVRISMGKRVPAGVQDFQLSWSQPKSAHLPVLQDTC